ncbi:PF08818 domain protein [Leptospira vanthielii serovar Holland str. Waz Holland = ATCC 700522]|uniref:PF08818 domain protein n=2 Tax=Leptospira vanthielii TaxID=293085 RepID=N1W4F6_9LEPT|nr:PF08818 domain protein [Leptospira vanthielii serovar Holland str. Waz Holland = ATCC 700522]
MGIYADLKLLKWFQTEYPKHCKTKLDMGKSCIRFKKKEEIPWNLIGELAKKISPKNWIALYEKNLKETKSNQKNSPK